MAPWSSESPLGSVSAPLPALLSRLSCARCTHSSYLALPMHGCVLLHSGASLLPVWRNAIHPGHLGIHIAYFCNLLLLVPWIRRLLLATREATGLVDNPGSMNGSGVSPFRSQADSTASFIVMVNSIYLKDANASELSEENRDEPGNVQAVVVFMQCGSVTGPSYTVNDWWMNSTKISEWLRYLLNIASEAPDGRW